MIVTRVKDKLYVVASEYEAIALHFVLGNARSIADVSIHAIQEWTQEEWEDVREQFAETPAIDPWLVAYVVESWNYLQKRD